MFYEALINGLLFDILILSVIIRCINNKQRKTFIMTNIREISIAKMKSFKQICTYNISPLEIKHMLIEKKDGTWCLDLDKATNAPEAALWERITKDPKRQSSDERSQFNKLQVFSGIKRLKPATKFLIDGIIYSDEAKITIPNPADLDLYLKDTKWDIVWTLKGRTRS